MLSEAHISSFPKGQEVGHSSSGTPLVRSWLKQKAIGTSKTCFLETIDNFHILFDGKMGLTDGLNSTPDAAAI